MIQFFVLVNGIDGYVDAQFAKDILIFLWKDDGGVDFAALELAELFHGQVSFLIVHGSDGQGNQQFIGMEARVFVA